MEFEQVIKKRRSIRKFTNQTVDKSLIEKLVEAANFAPSACNVQGWKFIIIDNQEIKNKIFDAGGTILIKDAPLGILIVYDNRTKNTVYHDDLQSACAAIENLILTATNLGLASCWICHLPGKKQLRKFLHIPSYFSPVAYIILGYPKNEIKETPRKYKIGEIMSYNEFSQNWPVDKVNPYILLLKKILVKIYYHTPIFIKKLFLSKLLDKNFVKKFEN